MSSTLTSGRTNRVQAIARATDVLFALSAGPQTLTDVSRSSGLSKGTAYRLLDTLSYKMLVIKEEKSNLYMLGPGALMLLEGVLSGVGRLIGASQSTLTRLWEESNETVTIHLRVGGERVCVYEMPSRNPLRFTTGVGTRTPLHAGSAGKAILAAMSPEDLDDLLHKMTLNRLTDRTLTDPTALARDLARIRRQGYSISLGEVVVGAAAVSIALRGSRGVLGSMSVLGPASRMNQARQRHFAQSLIEAGTKVEAVLADSVAG